MERDSKDAESRETGVPPNHRTSIETLRQAAKENKGADWPRIALHLGEALDALLSPDPPSTEGMANARTHAYAVMEIAAELAKERDVEKDVVYEMALLGTKAMVAHLPEEEQKRRLEAFRAAIDADRALGRRMGPPRRKR